MNEVKAIFEKLKTDVNIVLFTEEKINDNLFTRLKKSSYVEDKKTSKFDISVGKFR